jgi:copper chaperone CopZ
MEVKTIKIGGMTCMHCAAKVTTALKSIPGVQNVKVDMMNEEANVVVQGVISEDTFKQSVQKSGYQFISIK